MAWAPPGTPPMPAPGRKPAASNRAPCLLNVQAVADRLGVCSKTVRRRIACGDLHVHRLGGLVRVSEDDLASFLARTRR